MSGERIPFPPMWWRAELFYEVRRTALAMADKLDTPPYVARMLELLKDCEYLGGKQDHEGATYKSVAYAGRVHGLDALQRERWIETAEVLGLTQRHVGHLIAKVKDRGAAPHLRVVPDQEEREFRQREDGV